MTHKYSYKIVDNTATLKMNYIINAHNRFNIPIVRGKGVYLFNRDGKKYLDFPAGISTTSLGQCHLYIINKLKEQLDSL
ncbi:aminotransferase class III-fold pyridoxal phosphate-dependent enzyme [Wolbachia endosymbiont of Onchocerca ochengi]|uniref:aminotransferase class III-fold pyridoxal phosphate-dependent enzyme n=1 Tax=Wolbachia endosymbiont of Onchocerca ochengi TaxID=100901 RepID=UPI0021014185|nr:aminotransferase class III-fold pyridoxal phosphate-dependent enzyme [Wolbachia endosymbiont of Onchocerca ochengi]